jgi:hypothetical protein
MFKHLTICATFIAFATGSANAQQQEADLQRLTVPGAGFDLIVVTPKVPAATYDLGRSPEALIVHLIGGELALGFDAEEKMLRALDALQMPVCAFHAEGHDTKSRKPVAVYIVPRAE